MIRSWLIKEKVSHFINCTCKIDYNKTLVLCFNMYLTWVILWWVKWPINRIKSIQNVDLCNHCSFVNFPKSKIIHLQIHQMTNEKWKQEDTRRDNILLGSWMGFSSSLPVLSLIIIIEITKKIHKIT